jgi:hypothetical protein
VINPQKHIDGQLLLITFSYISLLQQHTFHAARVYLALTVQLD